MNEGMWDFLLGGGQDRLGRQKHVRKLQKEPWPGAMYSTSHPSPMLQNEKLLTFPEHLLHAGPCVIMCTISFDPYSSPVR